MNKYIFLFQNAFSQRLEYRVEVITDLLIQLVGLGLSLFLWKTIIVQSGSVGQYDLAGIFVYYLLSQIWGTLSGRKTMKTLEKFIRKGDLSNMLLKPMPVVWNFSLRMLAGTLFKIILTTAIFSLPIILVKDFSASLILSWNMVFWSIAYLILAASFNLIFYFFWGCLAFWLTSLGSFRNVLGQTVGILKGAWFPLDLAPFWFQNIIKYLPFGYITYYPIQIMISETTFLDNLRGAVILLLYTIVFFFAAGFIWKRGLLNYSAVGS